MSTDERCPRCSGGPVVPTSFPETFRLAGATFCWSLAARLCSACGEWQIPVVGKIRQDGLAVLALGDHGPLGPEAVRLGLATVGLDAESASRLLGVTPADIVAWCQGHRSVPLACGVLLLALVADVLAGLTTTRDRLLAAVEPRPLPAVLELPDPTRVRSSYSIQPDRRTIE